MAKPADCSYNKDTTVEEYKYMIDKMSTVETSLRKRIKQLERYNRNNIPINKRGQPIQVNTKTRPQPLTRKAIKHRIALAKIEKRVEHITISAVTEPEVVQGLIDEIAALCKAALENAPESPTIKKVDYMASGSC